MKVWWSTCVILLSLSNSGLAWIGPAVDILRGDVNNNGSVSTADSVYLSDWLFSGGPAPPCLIQADVNDDGYVNVSDVTYLSAYLNSYGPPPKAPFPNCDGDTTPDNLTCNTAPACH